MPTAMTFASLITDLQRYAERGGASDPEVNAQLPTLVNLAERDIATKLQILGLLEPLTDTMVVGSSVIQKPDRWRSTASFNFGVGTVPNQVRTPLFPRSYEYCREYWPNDVATERPRFYADYDFGHWLIVPTPDFAYPFEVNVWAQPPLLDAVNQTNWLTDYAPQALLYGSLVQLMPFLKDQTWSAAWKPTYVEELGALNGQDLQRIIDRTVTRRTV